MKVNAVDAKRISRQYGFGAPADAFNDAGGLANRTRRDRLVSALLQDRNVLRVISAPHGFGKTELAREYAARIFNEQEVLWVRASSPDFMRQLDGHTRTNAIAQGQALVVFDDLPYLDEVRAGFLSNVIDELLYGGIEVLVTTIPSNDCLRALQPERITLKASDMLVTENECKGSLPYGASAEATARANRLWRRAEETALGKIPLVFWGRAGNELSVCLRGLFGEKLPHEALRVILCALLLGEGDVRDLERAGCSVRPEIERMLMDDYPFFAIDPVRKHFSAESIDFVSIRDAVEESGLAAELLAGSRSLPQRVLELLFSRDDLDRAEEVLKCFCTDEQCASWLYEQGWGLLDKGNLRFVDALFGRCPDYEVVSNPVLVAMRAWACGLSGNWREATRDAHRVFRLVKSVQDNEQVLQAALAAKLALAAFGGMELSGIANLPTDAVNYASSPDAFLNTVMDVCTDIEIERAFSVDDAERRKRLERLRSAPDVRRAEQLTALFTEASFELQGTMQFRIALHILSFVDNSELRRLVQDLGCDEVISMRRHGVKCATEALLIRDLWASGYFGPLGRTVDKRDAQLLSSGSSILRKVCQAAGYDFIVVPWEAGGTAQDRVSSRYASGAAHRNAPDVPVLKVRLFGGFEVTVGEDYIDEKHWRRKARQFFIELVLQQGRDVARGELIEQLWPDTTRQRALDSFYTMWNNLVSIIGEGPYVERTGEFCRINPRYVLSDVAEFEQLTRTLLMEHDDVQVLLDCYARIEALYSGGLLPCEQGSAVVNAQRERYRAMYTDAMVAATSKAIDAGDSRLALWFARKGMEVEQKREDVYHALIKAQIAAGQRCSAIRTFFKCKEFLRNDLGLDPSLETQELYDNLIAVDPSLLKLDPASFRA